jgi:hypothetical protein
LSKTNPQPPYRLRLRLLAVHNEGNNLSDTDRQLISDLLRHLADGGNTEEFFGISSLRHRPTSPTVEQRIFDVCLAMAPKEEGGNGLSREQAISSVAKDHKIDDQKIKENLKSTRGKELYKRFSSVFLKANQGD